MILHKKIRLTNSVVRQLELSNVEKSSTFKIGRQWTEFDCRNCKLNLT